MFLRITKLLFLCGTLAVFMFGCDSGSDRTVDPVIYTTVSGNAAQVYVRGAMITADKIGGSDIGNFSTDSNETLAYTGADGSFTFELPETYGGYVLFSNGGTVADSNGNRVAAFPMLAPEGAKNITPVTTLVALNSSLKDKIGTDYDTDIADPAGAAWDIVQLAKVVEAVLANFTDKNNPIITDIENQFAVYKKIAAAFAHQDIDLTNDAHIVAAVGTAVTSVLEDNTIIQDSEIISNAAGIINVITECAETVAEAIPNSGNVVEDNVLATVQNALADSLSKIDGSTLPLDPLQMGTPFPNVLACAMIPGDRKGLVTIDPSTAGDLSAAALYTAVNALNIKGFSPNAIIGIPLDKTTLLDTYSLKTNIKLVNLNTLLGVLYGVLGLGDPTAVTPDEVQSSVITGLAQLDENGWAMIKAGVSQYAGMIYNTDIKVVQDGSYIKIFPLKPLTADSKYLVYIEDKVDDSFDDFTDENGIRLKQPALYKLLKSDQPLSGALAPFEEVRQGYSVIYNYFLKSLNVAKDDTLEMFTFTTADKTLSLTDFGIIATFLQSGDISGLADNLTDGLSYAYIATEYGTINGATALFPTGTGVIPASASSGAFVSFDFTTLSADNQDQEMVPYVIYNGDNYTDTLVIYQHGLGTLKTMAQNLADINYPIIAMDLPLHGDRTAEGAETGDGYLTTNMGSNRVNVYQSVFDMTLMLKNLESGKFDINGDGTPDTPATINFIGHSFGAVTGIAFSSYNSSSLDKIVLNCGGANIISALDESTNARMTGLVESFGVQKNTTSYFITLGMVQTLIDPADPIFTGNSAFNGNDPFSSKTIVQNGYKDTYVPNYSNEIFSNTVGYSIDTRTDITDFDTFTASENSSAGWYQFGGMAGKTDNWIKHPFIRDASADGYPEAEGYLDPVYLEGAQRAAHEQIIEFFGN